MSDSIRHKDSYLKTLGHSTFNSTETKYSVLEMAYHYRVNSSNEDVVKTRSGVETVTHTNILCNNILTNYLQASKGNHDEEMNYTHTTDIIIHKIFTTKYVVGVENYDGKKYAVKPPIYFLFFFYLFVGIAFLAVYVGIIFILYAAYELRNYLKTMRKLKAGNFVILNN